ncbi:MULTISPECIES: carboxynorspermidine decarboxylase [unclassified Sporosarcina]|uniref:carboxynorspermidine decarboxylase n=1 Tax=unclassified Sporosarcina TaxID=2647733 RepID=UPI00203FB807|nr:MULTISPECIES: carboxynorspermidine decarboxylase [unclassified Sporosarcina]GKV65025.1 carboxynorspermidine decarboxylase [Sporosarcina sp. NCCP-2331]GLB56660.1 carboxynorspermidine decarboxylase [Sporosarcina sp. NCCP-2378]
MNFDVQAVPSPSYVVEEELLINNLKKMKAVIDETGCKILLAQKGFSMFEVYPLIGKYLHGVTSSGLFEARLGYEEMGKEVHTYSPAFQENEFDEILRYSDHLVFNSFAQWNRFKAQVKNSGKQIECGIRINPEYSEIEVDMYNPCFSHSRFGVTLADFKPDQLDGISGLHFHTMCEQNSDTLWRTIQVVDEKFGPYLKQMKWINFGGGHHITRPDYDMDVLIRSINFMKEKYGLDVYLEPGEAVALNTGFLVATVLDTLHNGTPIAILDTSASCHMPDVLEMPYRPDIIGTGMPNEKAYTYRLGGPTCLAGDVIGDYSFDAPLQPGDRLVFCDMAHYSMVKNNTFNGMNLPAIVLQKTDGNLQIVKQFGYKDFKERLS